MKKTTLVHITYHPDSQSEKAKRFISYLSQLENIEITSYEAILAGENIGHKTFDSIQKANFILILLTRDYLSTQKEEIRWIKESQCYSNQTVIPIPIETCHWEFVFPDIKPICNKQKPIPFDEDGMHQLVTRVAKRFDAKSKFMGGYYESFAFARADSMAQTYSQEVVGCIPFNDSLKDDEILFTIQGDSMFPLFQGGDRLICKQVDLDQIPRNPSDWKKQFFVVRTQSNGFLLKYIKRISEKSILLASENTKHLDIEFDLEEVDSIFLAIKKNITRFL